MFAPLFFRRKGAAADQKRERETEWAKKEEGGGGKENRPPRRERKEGESEGLKGKRVDSQDGRRMRGVRNPPTSREAEA